MKSLRVYLIGLAFVALFVSTGFGMWTFFVDGGSATPINGGIDVTAMTSDELDVQVIPPTDLGFLDYTLAIRYGVDATERTDLHKNIDFLPDLVFTVNGIDDDVEAYYYLTFSSTDSMFGTEGYFEFDTSVSGQSEASKVHIEKDVDNNATISVTPIFKYRTGKKPQTTTDYITLAGMVEDVTGHLTLVVVVE